MTRDLEKTLEELDPEYGLLVKRMRAPFDEIGDLQACSRDFGFKARFGRSVYLIAASLAVVALSAAVVFQSSSVQGRSQVYPRCYTVALDADSAAIREIISTQRPDGSWSSDFLTCQNAAALRGVHGAELAYRKAVRYLKAKGLSPLSTEELKSRGRIAAGLLASI